MQDPCLEEFLQNCLVLVVLKASRQGRKQSSYIQRDARHPAAAAKALILHKSLFT